MYAYTCVFSDAIGVPLADVYPIRSDVPEECSQPVTNTRQAFISASVASTATS
jgi:hypothetical protein